MSTQIRFDHWLHQTAQRCLALSGPSVSFIISTFNRRDVLLGTLEHVQRCGLVAEEFETIVIDNASSDGTAPALRQRFPQVRLLELDENRGSCAKNAGVEIARGKYIVFLDDDSYPMPESIARMMNHFRSDPRLAAAGFTVHLTDGSRECSAYPDVFIGCGVGFRKRALSEVGALPDEFFMQAEEYDLSLRLLDAGWQVRTFDDLHVMHLKSPAARVSTRTMRLDVRNNLTLIARHFPRPWMRRYSFDWMSRYWMIASAKGQRIAFLRGLIEGILRAATIARRPVSHSTFEQFARIKQTSRRIVRIKDEYQARNVLFIDLGKNVLAYWLAARACGIQVVAIADKRLGGTGRKYRGIPIVTDDDARRMVFDLAIVANLSLVHATARTAEWRAADARPVIDLFEDEWLTAGRAERGSRQTVARSA
jgi:GT2 family glycosyltransferase